MMNRGEKETQIGWREFVLIGVSPPERGTACFVAETAFGENVSPDRKIPPNYVSTATSFFEK